jgi:hypothetical protein
VKANGFFFVGSVLFLTWSIWDVATINQNGSDDKNTAWETIVASCLVLAATLSYLANGLLEMKIAYTDYQMLKDQGVDRPPIGVVVNGGIFSLAAIFSMISLFQKVYIVFYNLSSHTYLVNSLLTLWLRKSADLTSSSAKLVRAGDLLFLMGVIIDLTYGYLELSGAHPFVMIKASLVASFAWFLDACCYVAADRFLVHDEDEEPKSADPTESFLVEETDLPIKLSIGV